MRHQRFGFVLLCGLVALGSVALHAQSTHGVFVGTVKDQSGSVVPESEVVVKSIDEGATHVVTSDAQGNYRAADIKPGHYRLQAHKTGFKTQVFDSVELLARQELRVDFVLTVGAVGEMVEVRDTLTGAINSETPSISASHSSAEVLDLPANYRAAGSTSPLALVQSLPGVQADSDGKFSVQGGLPFMSETSVDGITTQDTTSNNPLSNAWPSAESIGELRVEGVGNNAEFGQPGAITTVSKNGTNNYHGALFWYHQNAALDAIAYGQPGKPQKIGNDYGFTAGGPVRIPGLYNGRDRTFFFATYEGFRFPKGDTIHDVVPTEAMRNGDFSNAGIESLNNPFTGGTYGTQIPADAISSAASKLVTLYPLPNVGDVNVFDGTSNYAQNVDNSYNSKQFDIRGDQYIGTKTQMFGRFSWKNIAQVNPTNLLLPPSSYIDQYRMLVISATYDFRPTLLNEFRFGFTRNRTGNTNPFDGPSFAKGLGLANIGDNSLFFNGVTEIDFSSSMSNIGVDRLSNVSQSNTFQYTDTVSWTKKRHSMKFGLDLRHIEAITPLGFNGADNYGTFSFDSATFTGYDFADFLLGLPTNTFYDVVQQDNHGLSTYYNFYGQDTWQVTPRLTVSYGLRYEYHPGYHDVSGNIGNFDPSVPKSGRVIYPDGKAALLNPAFLADFNACPNLTDPGPVVNGAPCTPVLSASQAHLPQSLRTAEKLRLMPRIGIAFRPFNNDKTAIRAGFGMYNITTLGAVFYALTGTLQSGTQQFDNQLTGTGPLYQWPAISSGGSGYGQPDYDSAYFGTANDIHFKDPLSSQWNVSFDHELAGGIGTRVSYIGMKTTHLVWAPNYNDLSYSTTTSAFDRPQSDRPFPNWHTVNDRASSASSTYSALQFEANRRFRNGLSFTSAYTLAKNMADNQAHQQSFADENGGSRSTYFWDRHIDYGRVYGSRHHRWISTAIYTLPIGRGHALGNKWGRTMNGAFGGWRLSNIFLWQSGPFLTPYFDGGDPSGTGSGSLYGRSQYPDQVGNPVPAHQNAQHWINPAAFVCPGLPDWVPGTTCDIGMGGGTQAPIGRFGTTRPGAVIGPGTVNLSTGLIKEFAFTEHAHLTFNASFTNVLNHANLSDPDMDIGSSDFGVINSARGSDFGGSRTGQVSLRLEF
ncbi:MAG: TonB-dependent receptor [Acidobacteriia bacterium]|nr:TonB-dependent receptor [Terriglobia bacterium]